MKMARRIFEGTMACGVLVGLCVSANAQAPEVWFAPTDNVSQHGEDFLVYFETPQTWAAALGRVHTFSVTINYLAGAPPNIVRRQLALLRSHGIKLDVEVPGIAIDKHQCGDGIEGMMWPGEAALNARHLKDIGAEVDTFSFDLPLVAGHVIHAPKACQLSVTDTARRLATTVREMRAFYPNARFVDQEVPTGMPVAKWTALLRQWLPAYRAASGENFYGLTMDAWWEFPWQDTVRQTTAILHENGIRAGMFFDADGKPGMTAQQFRTDAEHNVCAVRQAAIPLDYVEVANWMVMAVKNLPESDPLTLTSFLDWVAAGTGCPSP